MIDSGARGRQERGVVQISALFRHCKSIGFDLREEDRRIVQCFARLCSYGESDSKEAMPGG